MCCYSIDYSASKTKVKNICTAIFKIDQEEGELELEFPFGTNPGVISFTPWLSVLNDGSEPPVPLCISAADYNTQVTERCTLHRTTLAFDREFKIGKPELRHV
jgi:hypothetical protein